MYEAWLSNKRVLADEALKKVTLNDLFRIHDLCTPGQVDVPLHWNALAMGSE